MSSERVDPSLYHRSPAHGEAALFRALKTKAGIWMTKDSGICASAGMKTNSITRQTSSVPMVSTAWLVLPPCTA